MSVSVGVTSVESQSVESSSLSREKLALETKSDKLRDAQEEVQRAKKALADFLEPAITAAKNEKLSKKTPDEIFKEAIEEVKGRVGKG